MHFRGSNFLQRLQFGQYSEDGLTDAVNRNGGFWACSYGASSYSPTDKQDIESYKKRYEEANPQDTKRPDLLIFHPKDKSTVSDIVKELGGFDELMFVSETDERMRKILSLAILAIECEASLWAAKKMPNYGEALRPQRRINNRNGLPKNAKVPTIIIKAKDLLRLVEWERQNNVPIHVWHAFFDMSRGISLNYAKSLINDGLIDKREQSYDDKTVRATYNIYYHYSYELATVIQKPTPVGVIDEEPKPSQERV